MTVAAADMQERLNSLDVAGLLRRHTDATVTERMMRYGRALLDTVAGVDISSVALLMQAGVEENVRQYELLEAVESAGLIAAPSMGRDLEDRMIAAYRSSADPEVIWKLAEAHYDADEAAALQGIVTRAKADKDLSGRPQNLDEVLDAHREGKNSLTTPSQVALIESVLVLVLEEAILPALGRQERVKHGTIVEIMLSVGFALPGLSTARILSLMEFMNAQMYRSFDWRSDPIQRDDASRANRHQLQHGFVAGNRRNTLRCFLVIDVLADVLPALRSSAGLP
jgi:hypothetical protein